MVGIETEVKRVIREALAVTEKQLTPDADLFDDLEADSLDVTEIVLQLEEAFGIEIPDEDAQKVRTVQEIIEYVKAHVPAEVHCR